MKKFELFAGLGGSFNNEVSVGVEEFEDEDDALDAAYEEACDTYDHYSGSKGVNTHDFILLDLKEASDLSGLTEDEQEEQAWEVYDQERDSLLKYHVVEIIE